MHGWFFGTAKYGGSLSGLRVCRDSSSVTHLFFADDSMDFGEATEEESQVIKSILEKYKRTSGHQVIFEKFVLFFNTNVEEGVSE